jgi:hypothetical protein
MVFLSSLLMCTHRTCQYTNRDGEAIVRCDSRHPIKTLVCLLYAKVWFTILHFMLCVIILYVFVYPTFCVYIVLCVHELSCYVYGAILSTICRHNWPEVHDYGVTHSVSLHLRQSVIRTAVWCRVIGHPAYIPIWQSIPHPVSPHRQI